MRKNAALGVLVSALVLSLVWALEGRKDLATYGLFVVNGSSALISVWRQRGRQHGKEAAPEGAIRPVDEPAVSPLRSLALTALGVLVFAVPVFAMAWGLSLWGAEGRRAPFTLNGEMALYESWGLKPGTSDHCEGRGGFSDIVEGTPVKVYDEHGGVVATGALGAGTPSKDKPWCVFPVRVADVPRRPEHLEVEVGHRGKLKISNAEARRGEFGAYLD